MSDKTIDVGELQEKLRPDPVGEERKAREKRLRAEIKRLHEEVGRMEIFVDEITSALEEREPYKIKYRHRRKRSGKDITLVQKLNDWHAGQHINPKESNGNAYSVDIFKDRVEQHFNVTMDWVKTLRAGYSIPNMAIIVNGDLASGDIHDELRITNEITLPEQVVLVMDVLSELVMRYSEYFKKIDVHVISGDNHGRLTKKPQFKQKARNNVNWIIAQGVERITRGQGNVEFHIYESIRPRIEVNGHYYMAEHGDTIKAWMGIPFYSVIRKINQMSFEAMESGRPFDKLLLAHFHQSAYFENFIMGGSLSGTDELDFGVGRYAKPGQVNWLVHPEHGDFMPLVVRFD